MQSDFVKRWSSQVKKGTLSLIVLNILKDKEFYGYELILEVKKRTSIEIADGTIYPLLIRLKKEEIVSSRWEEQESGIPRKYYKLTDFGLEALEEMTQHWEDLNSYLMKLKKT